MPQPTHTIDVYLEVGQKRTLAAAIEWPGWCRGGRDEASALQALADYGPRYARVARGARLAFQAPADASSFSVVERLKGNATTDFGAPDNPPSCDAAPLDDADHRRYRALLKASWRAFDDAAEAAEGKELRKGPRGGGRDVTKITQHLLDSDRSYSGRLAWKVARIEGEDLRVAVERTRDAMLDALAAGARGEIPDKGPRGGALWTPRFFVRRTAWHVLDHAWEIEDRTE